jgi:GTPase Era involved in 16S rRNA processing
MSNNDQIVHELQVFLKEVQFGGSEDITSRVRSLIDKSNSESFYIAFCGHFSAGKSSMINQLCDSELLPSSPIPTSANVVSIRNGNPAARITYTDGRKEQRSIAEVSNLAKDGNHVQTVDLFYPIPFLGSSGVLLDSPGVDSTDDAHRLATEAALHLADTVCYIMDYNHVLSEINLNFAKHLCELGKPLILIVNQIDKHQEQELSFVSFRQGVVEAFQAWGISFETVLFTSLRDQGNLNNEFSYLRQILSNLVKYDQSVVTNSIAKASVKLAMEYVRERNSRNDSLKIALHEKIGDSETEAYAQYTQLLKKRANQERIREELTELFIHEVTKIAENANITPANTRDAAQLFLESVQPGFRVGFLFAHAKTEDERKRRLQTFYVNFSEQVTAHLLWHIRDHVKNKGIQLQLTDRQINIAMEAVQVPISPEWIVSKIRPGAIVSGEYTLNYARELAAEVRQMAKRSAIQAAERLADAAEAGYALELPQLQNQLAVLEEKIANIRALESIETEEREVEARILSLLPYCIDISNHPMQFPNLEQWKNEILMDQQLHLSSNAICSTSLTDGLSILNLSSSASAVIMADHEKQTLQLNSIFVNMASMLEKACDIIADVPSLSFTAHSLRERARKLREQRFTAALFGAFSAGKSSFANALLGDSVLPVSPNPTTAAINTIEPPNSEWKHGMAKIVMKPSETILSDINHSFEALGILKVEHHAKIIETLQKFLSLEQGLSTSFPAGGKPHLSFLRAVAEGWKESEPLLGSTFPAEQNRFTDFVANEKNSAFVDHIQLHYNSTLSRQGITLVDTPGADSMNARHTGVTFNYMKNADAIFFVTYYNHAFSRADRQFLEQLGRVKETFELDKMFFIVNAADLAANANELQEVLDHVRSNLALFGIRNPRIFPISSLEGLKGKKTQDEKRIENSGITAFESAFAQFSKEELAGLAYRAADSELIKCINQFINILKAANTSQFERKMEIERSEQLAVQARNTIIAYEFESLKQDVMKETAEQCYYLKQRISYRFGEWFTASFNPSVLREDQGEIKQSLAWAWRDLVSYISKELIHEMLAISLRLEKFMHRSIENALQRWNEGIQRIMPNYELGELTFNTFETPEISKVWAGEEPQPKLLTTHYRNAKYFFEGPGRTALRADLEKRWKDDVDHSIEQMSQYFMGWSHKQLATAYAVAQANAIQTVDETLQTSRAGLTEQWNISDLEKKKVQLEAILLKIRSFSRDEQE